MSNKIQKINKLKKIEGFIQVNYLKGFKYVDKAGEFFNHFCKDDTFPPYSMDPVGMTVKIDNKTEIKVSPHQVWMHFVDPASFEIQKRVFIEKAELANSIFDPEKYTRIGWRNYLVYECQNYPNIIPEDLLYGGDFSEIVFTKNINNFSARIGISKLIRNDNSQKKAILFDIDIYKKEDISHADFDKIKDCLDKMEDAYRSDELLNLVNEIISK